MKTEKELNRIGKFMSLVLRHKPEEANLSLDKEGFVDVSLLKNNLNINTEELDWIVNNNNKKRFAYNDSKTKIRANQGHSINEIEITFDVVKDVPDFLYHGTSSKILELIMKEGIKKMSRTHIHLSGDLETAIIVGRRKDKNIVVLSINSKKMSEDGLEIFISKNGVYLADNIPAKYLESPLFY